MLSPKIKKNIFRIIPFGLIWLVFSIVYSLLERGILGDLTYYPSTGNPYNFINSISVVPVTAGITGLLIGTIEVLYFNKVFIHKSFILKIVYKTTVYLAFIIFFLIGLSVMANAIELQTSFFDERVLNNTLEFFTNYAFWSVVVYVASIIGFSLFYTEVSENIGQGVLNNFLTGKYHTPIVEERIFMFLDMKSSTTIAENIGHVKYFEMLKEYFSDLTEPIIGHVGEIYQYVGDEIVVSWKLNNGLQNNNCINCFFAMKSEIKSKARKYIEKFGVVPEFKAGFHIGKVTTGEIGVVKKDIIFTGDVLNTTARIQALCNSFKVDLLVSEHLMKNLGTPTQYKVILLGESEIRGKDEKIKLFTMS